MSEKSKESKFDELRKPLKAEDVEIRVSNVFQGCAKLLLYKTARVDSKRLDNIFGGNWKREHYYDVKGNMVCKISIYNDEIKEWVSREDVGVESFTEREKGLYSDSFKRAGFAWGIGTELYNSPNIIIKCDTELHGKIHKLKNSYYFNDCIVSKFDVKDGNVFVEIKKNGTVLFTNYRGEENIIKTKQDAVKVANVIQSNIKKITEEQVKELQNLCKNAETPESTVCNAYQVNSLADIPSEKFERIKARLIHKTTSKISQSQTVIIDEKELTLNNN